MGDVTFDELITRHPLPWRMGVIDSCIVAANHTHVTCIAGDDERGRAICDAMQELATLRARIAGLEAYKAQVERVKACDACCLGETAREDAWTGDADGLVYMTCKECGGLP